ncbi:hypothetical protein FAZ69_17580 [Trinickia terrae]|uniref:Transposase DDE domain-containing protein n=1 Tax=Trinickia terrae TaxID=2571161 RepID=A0A4U1I1X2_9BURK|nr:hypothetical protein FAZ69_17580 [Trinickia terrae]
MVASASNQTHGGSRERPEKARLATHAPPNLNPPSWAWPSVQLGLRSRITKAHTIIYRSSQTDCSACPMKQQCCPTQSTGGAGWSARWCIDFRLRKADSYQCSYVGVVRIAIFLILPRARIVRVT